MCYFTEMGAQLKDFTTLLLNLLLKCLNASVSLKVICPANSTDKP